VSSWMPVGRSYADTAGFGTVVVGPLQDYFERRLKTLASGLERRIPDGAARKKAQGAICEMSDSIAAHGGEARAFPALEALLANLDRTLSSCR